MNSDDQSFVFWVGEIVDKAIVNMALSQEINVLDIHKGVFIYLLLLAKRKKYDKEKIMKILDFMPYKSGLISAFVEGALEEMRGYQDIYVSGKGEQIKIKSSQKAMSMPEYRLDEDEQKVLNLIWPLNQWDVEVMLNEINENEKMAKEGAKA